MTAQSRGWQGTRGRTRSPLAVVRRTVAVVVRVRLHLGLALALVRADRLGPCRRCEARLITSAFLLQLDDSAQQKRRVGRPVDAPTLVALRLVLRPSTGTAAAAVDPTACAWRAADRETASRREETSVSSHSSRGLGQEGETGKGGQTHPGWTTRRHLPLRRHRRRQRSSRRRRRGWSCRSGRLRSRCETSASCPYCAGEEGLGGRVSRAGEMVVVEGASRDRPERRKSRAPSPWRSTPFPEDRAPSRPATASRAGLHKSLPRFSFPQVVRESGSSRS